MIRIQRRDNCVVIQKANGSVFSSRRPGKISTYRITDWRVFRNWRDEVIPIEFHRNDSTRSDDEDEGFQFIRSDQDIRLREAIGEEDWIEVEKVS